MALPPSIGNLPILSLLTPLSNGSGISPSPFQATEHKNNIIAGSMLGLFPSSNSRIDEGTESNDFISVWSPP